MPHLLNVWPSASQRLRDAQGVLLLFDYDGTLTPIADRPSLALLPPETGDLLLHLNRQEKFLVGIISGRSLNDLTAMVDIDGLIYAGNHGLEIRGPGLDYANPEAFRLAGGLGEVYSRLQCGLAHLPGVLVEHKGLTLTVHYRMALEAAAAEVEAAVAAATGPLVKPGRFKITRGKKVVEVRPAVPWHKGKAISKLQSAYPQATLPVFFGDDLTDEDGFEVVQDAGGLAVFVGPARAPTCALHRVDSPREVVEILRLMEQL
jgi:trehalose 6-phosphate phosphatase